MSEGQETNRLILLARELSAAFFLIVLCLWFWIFFPGFGTAGNVRDVLVQISGIAIAAAGMTFVIITAGIDLSVGSVLAFAGCTGTLIGLRLSQGQLPWFNGWFQSVLPEGFIQRWVADTGLAAPLGFAGGLATGALAGWINGLLITKLRLPPFIMTLGTMSVARGLAYQVSSSAPVQVIDGMRLIATARWFDTSHGDPTAAWRGIPFPIILLFLVYGVCWFMLRYMRVGRYSYAIGGNEEAARLSGVRIDFYLIVVYTMGGMLAAVSGLIAAGRLGWMAPQEGDAFELDVIAAVVIGGTSLAGGRGSLISTLLGALIIGVVRNGMALRGVDYNLQKVVLGLIIIVAVAVDVITKRMVEKA